MNEKEIKEKEWYSNKALFEMIQDLRIELAEATRLIREYNGLRKRINSCEQMLAEISGQGKGSKDMWGYVVGGIGIVSFILSIAMR